MVQGDLRGYLYVALEGNGFLGELDGFAHPHDFDLSIGRERFLFCGEAVVEPKERDPGLGQRLANCFCRSLDLNGFPIRIDGDWPRGEDGNY